MNQPPEKPWHDREESPAFSFRRERTSKRYRKSAGIGTLASFTIPLAAIIWVVWVAFFIAWYLLGIPLGPGA